MPETYDPAFHRRVTKWTDRRSQDRLYLTTQPTSRRNSEAAFLNHSPVQGRAETLQDPAQANGINVDSDGPG